MKKNNININKMDEFPLKGNLTKIIKKINKKWKKENVYEKILNKKRKKIILHDGPPYANGKIHLGHVINKIIKDIIIKKNFLIGNKVLYLPGWDCHGLPIEINVGKKKTIGEYRKYAIKQIEIQKKQFKKLGCIYDWKKIYKTMSPEIQYREIKFFIKLIKKRKIFIKKKKVFFCKDCNSSLSDFETEKKKKKKNINLLVFLYKKKKIIIKSKENSKKKIIIKKKSIFYRCYIDNNCYYMKKNILITLIKKYLIDKKNFSNSNKKKCLVFEKEQTIFFKKPIFSILNLSYICEKKICWRHKSKIIKKKKKQFFINVGLKKKYLSNIKFFPKETKKKFIQNVFKRPNWNISRRRTWGVPMLIFMKKNKAIYYKSIIRKIKKYGIKIWKKFNTKNKKYKKCKDILDVWFDSGITHYTVLKNRKNKKRASFPSDIYFEGKDQHRGWFNASFITSFLINKKTPFRKLVTHGFAVDSKGEKMSKSKKNYTDINELLKRYNIEIIRMFITSSNFFNDISISDEKIKNVRFDYIKIRSIIKFCLQNIKDLSNPSKKYLLIDKYIIYRFNLLIKKIKEEDSKFKFYKSYLEIKKFLFKELSNFYISSIKDRLYILQRKSQDRISCQSVIRSVLKGVLIMLSPYISYTAEEAWRAFFSKESIFIQKQKKVFCDINLKEIKIMKEIIKIKKKFDKIDDKNKNKKILYIFCNNHNYKIIKQLEKEIKFFLHNYKNIVLKSKKEKISLGKEETNFKCYRCWNFVKKIYAEDICKRCFLISIKKKIKLRKYF